MDKSASNRKIWAAAAVVARHLFPWTAIALRYFLAAEPPRRESPVASTLPGLVLFAGLTTSLLGAPGGPLLVLAGAVGGLGAYLSVLPSEADSAR